ncbi:hypothetical protein YA0783_12790 [Pseudomonas corrugata]|nr:hypothetical protein [Pseudomonas corrugata]MBI6619180.1 hypothetical protein [Pseudomonas corrugata]MBI6693413.1 hypothetical protein [Pseudomonas corrugata]
MRRSQVTVPGDLDFHHAAVGVDELTPGMPVREDEPLEPNFIVGAALVSSEILLVSGYGWFRQRWGRWPVCLGSN